MINGLGALGRIGLLEVWAVLAHDYGLYGLHDRITSTPGLRLRPSLARNRLDEVQQAAYRDREAVARTMGPWDRKIPCRT